jgi:hypothetical protein
VRNNQQAVVVFPANINLRNGAFDRYLKQYFLYENVQEVLCIPQYQDHTIEIIADWFHYSDGCLSGNNFKYLTRNNDYILQASDKSYVLNELPSKNEAGFLHTDFESKPLLIPLNNDESSIYKNRN